MRTRLSAFAWDSWRFPAPPRNLRPVAVALTAARASAVSGFACLWALPFVLAMPPMTCLTPSWVVGFSWPVLRCIAAKVALCSRIVATETSLSSASSSR